jgi:hypothetical protein
MLARRTALALVLLLPLSVVEVARADAVPPLRERTTVSIGTHRIAAEVARTSAEQQLGLGRRDGLAPGTGMVFPYTEARRWTFWMKDMRFDIDIVWIRDGKIVDVSRFVPAPRPGAPSAVDDLPTFSPSEPADTVLEVVAGTANARGWKPGDSVRFDPPVH